MENIILCPETVDAYRKLMTDQKPHGLDMPSLSECFQDSTEGTPKDILFKMYIEKIGNKPLPKVFFYIVMDEIYHDKIIKCTNGDIGYKLKMVEI